MTNSLPRATVSPACRCTYSEDGDERPLQQPHQHVAPVVFVVRHAGVADIQRERHQEELDGGSNQPRPLPSHPGLDVELHTHTRTHTAVN